MTHDHDPKEMECKEVVKKIFDYIDGELDENAHADIEHHMHSCRSCFSRAEFEAELKNRVKKSGDEKVPDELSKRLNDIMDNF